MGLATITVLALGMSMDAFAASLVRGACTRRLDAAYLCGAALLFGVVEMTMPLIGFALGSAAGSLVGDWDHWVAFALLSALGVRMILSARQSAREAERTALEGCCCRTQPEGRAGFWMLATTAVASSIDSLVVGTGLAFVDADIWTAALCIGLATTLMAGLGLWLGHRFGSRFGSKAEFIGGLLLIIIGTWILIDHAVLSAPV